MTIKSKQSRLFFLALATIFALPFSFGRLSGFFLWTSPLLFLSLLVSRQQLSFFSVIGAVMLILVTLRHRWYCRWMCPTRVLCDGAAQFDRLNWMRNLPPLGIYIAAAVLGAALIGVFLFSLLDPIAVFHGFFSTFRAQSLSVALLSLSGLCFVVGINFLSRHAWCQKLCPLGGLQDALTFIRKIILHKTERSSSVDIGRRAAMSALGGFGLGLLCKKSITATTSMIRPPASLPESDFFSTCLRCGNCMRACPMDIIRPSFDPRDCAGLLTPFISFSHGYCLPQCSKCGAVCPSGAIGRFSVFDKKSLVMGIARIDVANCLLLRFKECDRCRFYCEYDAVSIRTSDMDFKTWPEIELNRCVGCGACAVVCPARVITIEPPMRCET